MNCEACGATNRGKAKFCRECGEKIRETGNISSKQTDRQKKNQEKPGGKKGLWLGLALAGLVVISATFFLFSSGSYQKVFADNGEIRIALASVSDDQAHFFQFDSPRGPVKFFVLQAPDGQVRAALDACDVCYKEKKGYRQDGSEMVCINCENRFPAEKINLVRGGCNPVPLTRRITGDTLVLDAAELERMSGYF